MLKSICKSNNRHFYHIFVSRGDAPGVITLNVVSMEREFDAYKLSRCMCPSNYNRFWDRARYWSKIVIFNTPLHSTPPLGGVPVGIAPPRLLWKTTIAWLPDGEKISKISLFVLAQLTSVTDGGQTHTQPCTACRHRPRLHASHRAAKMLRNWWKGGQASSFSMTTLHLPARWKVHIPVG